MKIKYHRIIDNYSQLAIVELSGKSEILIDKVLLDNYSKDTYNAINNENIKMQWLTVRLLLNKLLGQSKQIEYDENNKPHLTDKSYYISISHIKDYIAILISRNKNVGIDIEIRDNRIFRIINKFLNKNELSFVEKENEQTKYLLYWNAKEALYKLYGKKGLIFKENILLSSFVLKDEGAFNGKIDTDNYKKEFVINYKLFDDFTLAWCLE